MFIGTPLKKSLVQFRDARDSTQLHWTLVRSFAPLVNSPHVILNLILSLKPLATLQALKINPFFDKHIIKILYQLTMWFF